MSTPRGKTTHTHTFIHNACMHSYIHESIDSYMHTSIHSSIHAVIHSYIRTFVHSCIHTFMHSYTRAFIHPCIHTFVHSYIHALICSYIYTLHTMTWGPLRFSKRSPRLPKRLSWRVYGTSPAPAQEAIGRLTWQQPKCVPELTFSTIFESHTPPQNPTHPFNNNKDEGITRSY